MTQFNGVTVIDGELQLVDLSETINETEYPTSGEIPTKLFYVGDPEVKLCPDFTGTFSVEVTGIFNSTVVSGLPASEQPVEYITNEIELFANFYRIVDDVDVRTPVEDTTPLVVTRSYLTQDDAVKKAYIRFELDVPAGANSVVLLVRLNSEDGKTPRVQTLKYRCPTLSYTREVTVNDDGDQEYLGENTGISVDSTFDSYYIDANYYDVGETAPIGAGTIAAEFFNAKATEALEQIIGSTLKPQAITPDLADGLPEGRSVSTFDSHWEIQIDRHGVLRFGPHIGKYYGKYSSKKFTLSVAEENVVNYKVSTKVDKLINKLIYSGQGINGINVLRKNDLIDVESVRKHGLRPGAITEKGVYDAVMIDARARALLREHANPTTKVTVELAPNFFFNYNVGDIIFLDEVRRGVRGDYRIVKKTTKYDGGKKSFDIELSNRTTTLTQLFSRISNSVKSVSDGKIGAVGRQLESPTKKLVSRDIPYVLQVVIPSDADRNLQRVRFSMYSEPYVQMTTVGLPTEPVDNTHTHATSFTPTYLKNGSGDKLFPVGFNVYLNDGTFAVTDNTDTVNIGPITELNGTGKSELGDFPDSQDSCIGFSLRDYDISHHFKTEAGNWLPGTHYVFIKPRYTTTGLDNTDNLGFLSAGVVLERVSSPVDGLAS